jgi:hypothetical protein
MDFFAVFQNAAGELEAQPMPTTAYLAIPYKLNLLSLVEIKVDDSDFFRKLRERQNHFLWTCGKSSDITNKLAISLNAEYNGLTFLN